MEEKKPKTPEDKLDRVATLVEGLTYPMEAVLKEAQASNRSRWIVLACMVCITVSMVMASLYVLKKMDDMAERTAILYGKAALSDEKLDKVMEVTQSAAPSSDVVLRLEEIKEMTRPTASNMARAILEQRVYHAPPEALSDNTDKEKE